MSFGVDITYIPRFKDKNDLAKRILSANELQFYIAAQNKAEFLAGRFAAKEAFIKANVHKTERIAMQSIEVLYEGNGHPVIVYEGKKHEVSISHDGDYAIAVAKVKE